MRLKIILFSLLTVSVAACTDGTPDVAAGNEAGNILGNDADNTAGNGAAGDNAAGNDAAGNNTVSEDGGDSSSDPDINSGDESGEGFDGNTDDSFVGGDDTDGSGNDEAMSGDDSADGVGDGDSGAAGDSDSGSDSDSDAGSGSVENSDDDSSDSADGGVSDGPVCIDTVPVGDGWGWDGAQSCRIGDGSNADSLVELLGIVKLYPDRAQADFARASFGRIPPNSLTEEEIRNFYVPRADTCEVAPVTSGSNDEPQFQVLNQQLDLISSGETVLISSDAGTFATLNRVDGANGPSYRTDVTLTTDAPNGLTVDVLGDDFPAFSSVPVSDVPPLQVTNPPVGQNIDAYNFFTWNANDNVFSVVEIYTGGVGANNQEIIVGCTAIDDGAFVFPNAVRAQMGNSFDDNWTIYLRIVYTITQDGDAMLVTANSVFADR